LLKERGVSDILLIGGGVIPGKDKKQLEEKGVKGNFGPGTPLEAIIEFIHSNIKK
jgi:methylmalonyl-CoA mutase C-terminal domain/subunit